jgi:hypothetical protein
VKALTVRQPWGWAIAAGHKAIENRTWNTAYRGPLAIHAASRWDGDEALKRVYELTGAYVLSTSLSAVIAVVDLVGVCAAPDGCDCGPWAISGHKHWQLANARELAYPVACKGRLGLWELPADVESSVLAQSGEAS